MNRRYLTATILFALLFTLATSVLAESLERPIRRGAARGRGWHGEGFQGRTILRVHMGLSAPTGDADNAFETGWGMGTSVGYGVSRNVLLSWGIAYHRFGSEFTSGRLSVTPVTMSADVALPTSGSVRPWFSGGLGLYHVSEKVTVLVPPFGFITASDSENDFGINLGMGITTPVSPRTAFGAGFKFHHIIGNDFPDTDFITFQAGFGLPL